MKIKIRNLLSRIIKLEGFTVKEAGRFEICQENTGKRPTRGYFYAM